MQYNMTTLEKTVKGIYERIGINEVYAPIDEIAGRLGVELIYGRKAFRIENIICLDSNQPKEKMRQAFAHELCHCLFHVGNQLNMHELYRQYQEFKAENFAMHFCVPTFILQKLELPNYKFHATSLIAETFGVTNEFALKRLEHYERQVFGAIYHKKILSIYSKNKYTGKQMV